MNISVEKPMLLKGDCLELMKTLPDKSVDLFICDLPYGETNCSWDTKIDMAQFWKEFKRIRKSKRTACIHFCSTGFGYSLIKSWEKGFKMDMVWKKRNKTGGLQSKYRPMRNHEMVYFFYEQAPKYNRDKYHKRIKKIPNFEKDDESVYGCNKKENTQGTVNFEPPNPASVLEEKYTTERKSKADRSEMVGGGHMTGVYTEEKIKKYNDDLKAQGLATSFDPPNPASVLEEKYTTEHIKNKRAGNNTNSATDIFTKEAIKKFQKENGANFQPPNPASVLEEDEPMSMFESKKVFIGKRNHQTEKPQDILEFFLKYWSDEGDVILDPTMGSGSTGVACKKLKRNFVGIELTDKYYEVAQKRISPKN